MRGCVSGWVFYRVVASSVVGASVVDVMCVPGDVSVGPLLTLTSEVRSEPMMKLRCEVAIRLQSSLLLDSLVDMAFQFARLVRRGRGRPCSFHKRTCAIGNTMG